MDEQSLRNLLSSLDNEDLSEHGFVTCSNALLELDVRNVDLPEDLRILLQYKMTRYGMQYLAGPLKSSTWSESVDRVLDQFQRLQGQPSSDSFSVDDETLLLLKLIHNELWCLERVEQLQMIPLKEVAFCLALFLLVFKLEDDFKVYRLVLNRWGVMEFLEAVVVLLQKVKVEGVSSPGDYNRFVCKKHRKVFKRLAKVYAILHRLYYMQNIQRDISAIIENDVDETIRNTSMDRLLYKFKQHAELLSVPLDLREHSIAYVSIQESLVERGKSEEDVAVADDFFKFYQTLYQRLPILETIFRLGIFLQIHTAHCHFLKIARNCSQEQLKSLLNFVDLKAIESAHEEKYNEITQFYEKLENHLYLQNMKDLQNNLQSKLVLLRDMKSLQISSIYFLNLSDMDRIKKMINLDLVCHPAELVKLAFQLWKSVQPEVIIFDLLEQKLKSSNLSEMIEAKESELETNSEADVNSFENMDVNELINSFSLMQVDVFESYASTLKPILESYNCESIQKLILNHSTIPRNVLMVLNHWQMEFYEFLKSSKKICDSSELVFYGIGELCCNFYHEFLKDENPNFVSVLHNEKLNNLINALVLTDIRFQNVSLQQKRVPECLKDIRFEAFAWNDQQKELLQAALHLNFDRFHENINTGSKVNGKFWYQLDVEGPSKYYDLGTILAYKLYNQPCDLFFQMLFLVGCDSKEKYRSKEFQLQIALDLGHFDRAIDLCSNEVTNFPERIFSWNDLIKSTEIDTKSWDCETLSFLVHKFVTFINISALKDLLNFRPDFKPDKDLMLKAISTSSEELLKVLIGHNTNLDEELVVRAVESHLSHVIFKQFDDQTSIKFVTLAIKSNNIEAINQMFESVKLKSIADQALITSISFNRIEICKYLLVTFPQLNLNSALFAAVVERRWKLASIFLKHGANPHFRTNSSQLVVFGIQIETAFQVAIHLQCFNFVKKCAPNVKFNQKMSLLALAASSGSVRMVRHLLRVGFKVIFDSWIVPVTLGLRHSEILGEIAQNIQLNIKNDGKGQFDDWYNLLETSKYLPFLENVQNSQEFQLTQNVEFQEFVLRRITLYKRIDAQFLIDKFNIYSETVEDCADFLKVVSKMQQILESLDSNVFKQFNFEIFSNDSEIYAFAKLTVVVDLEFEEENLCTNICLDEGKCSFDSIHDRIIQLLQNSFKFKIYSCDVKIFNIDSTVQRFLKLQIDTNSYFAELQTSNYFTTNKNNSLVTLMKEISIESRLQVAVGSGDVESTRALIAKIGHSDHQDLWMDPSLFHKVVDYDGKLLRRSWEMASFLLDAGMSGWNMHPKTVQSLISYALSKDRTDLAELVLKYALPEDMSEEQKVLKVLQHGSLETFKFCQNGKMFKESNLFMQVSNALLELNIRGVSVGEELQTFLLHKLATHGFNHFCGDPVTPKSPTEWLDSLKFIVEWSNELLARTDCNDFLSIDNEVLFKLRMIHNQLHFIKDKIHLKMLPLKKVMFLLAIFISSVKDDDCEIYRMVLNKLTVINILKSIVSEFEAFVKEFSRVSLAMKIIFNEIENRDRILLEASWSKDSSLPKLSDNVWNKLTSKKNFNLSNDALTDEVFGNESIDISWEVSGKSMKIMKFTTKLYHRVRQMYSLNKVFTILENFSPTDCSKEVTVASMKRFVQIFGESIKNTTNSMNLPAKLNKILTRQLSAYVKHNKQTRDITCHDFPLVKKYFSTEDQFVYYQVSVGYLEVIKVTMSILLICTTFEFTRCLFGSLRSCKSLTSVQSMIRFVGEQNQLLPLQDKLLNGIKKYNKEVESLLNAIRLEELTKGSREALERLKINHSRRTPVIAHLETMLISKFYYKYHELQVAAFSAPSIQTFHRMLQMNLNHSTYGYLPLIHNEWEILVSDLDLLPADIKLPERESSSMAKVQIDFEINQKIAQEHHCRDEVSRICEYLFEGSEISDSDQNQLESQLYQKLQGTKGKGYFGNIFAIDAKVQAIGQVFKQRNVQHFELKVKDLREKDVADLEEIFKCIQRSILRVLEKHNCVTIENMIVNLGDLPTEVILAIEYWMLELCEILITTKQFQDNYHTIKQGIQMICGRNFRNYLAHDSISYDLLTNSSKTKVLVNALVMATKDWKIFGGPQKKDLPKLNDARSESLSWIKSQKDLKQSVLTFDLNGIKSSLDQGALLSGTYMTSPGLYSGLRSCNLSEMLLHEHYEHFSHQNVRFRSVVTMMSPEAPGKWNELSSPKMKIEPAMSNGKFSKALNFAESTWPKLLKNFEFMFITKLFLGGLLKFLEETKDISTMFDILISWGPELLYVLLAVGSNKLVDFILKQFPKVRDYAQQHAIIARRNSQEYLEKLIQNGEAEPAHLTAAAVSDNFPAFNRLIQTRNFIHSQELENTLLVCSKFGRSQMIQLLLERFPTLLTAIDKALKAASEFRRWKTALVLLRKGANPWWKDGFKERSPVELAVGYNCLKILRHFLKRVPENTSGILTLAAGKGSIRMMKALLQAGLDICQDQRVLSVASANTVDKRMMAFVEGKIFNVVIPEGFDPNLCEWLKMLQELKIRKYFDSTGFSDTGELAMCLRVDHDLFHRILAKLDSLITVKVFGFNENDKEDLVQQCATIQNTILQMHKTDKFILQYQEDSLKIECIIFGTEHLTSSSEEQSVEKICFKYSKHSLPQVGQDLPEYLKDRFIPLGMDCKVTLLGQSYRLLQVASQRCFMKVLPQNSSILRSLLNAQNSTGQTILHHLPSSISFDIFEQLISRGVDLSVLDHQGKSALYTLLQQTMPWSVLHQIFDHAVHTNPNLLKVVSLDGTTLLSQAASMCKLEAVRFLLDHGADQSVQARDGSFPLYNAVMVRSVPIVKALLAQDPSTVVNIRRSDTWETALFAAAGLNNVEMVQLFLDSGADCTLRDIEGFTVVAKAIVNGCRDSLKVLLEYGKRSGIDVVNNVAPANLSALHIGLVKDNVDTFRTVLEFLVGGPIDDGLSAKSLTKLKKILQLNDYLMGFTILTAATLSESHKIVAYLNQVISVYNRLTNEDLNVGGVPILPGFSQDMFLSGGNIENVDDTFNGGVLDPAFLNNISELENMSRELEQMLQSMNMLV